MHAASARGGGGGGERLPIYVRVDLQAPYQMLRASTGYSSRTLVSSSFAKASTSQM